MKNILMVVDVKGWALDNLAQSIKRYNERYNFFFVYVHPRKIAPAIREIQLVLNNNRIDIIHYNYWRLGTQLIDLIPDLKKYPSVCSHHNTKHLKNEDWKKYFTVLVAPTRFVFDELMKLHDKVSFIPYGIDLNQFLYIKDRKDDGETVGSIGRVVEHKNLAKICDAARNIGAHVLASGYIEDEEYYKNKVDSSVLEFHGGNGRNNMNSWESKNTLYEKMTVYAMQSTSYETGPLPMLEAMAKGIPVIATRQGMANDIIENGRNGLLCEPEEFEDRLKLLLSDRKLQDTLRKNARKTIHKYSDERIAIQYGNLYMSLVHENKKNVSVIIPTCDRVENIKKIFEGLKGQSYKPFEVILVDNSTNQETEEYIKNNSFDFPIAYIREPHVGYDLAKSRNRGVIEARGELLIFCDDRLRMEENAVQYFVDNTLLSQWNFGAKYVDEKMSANKSFVENFSAVHRQIGR